MSQDQVTGLQSSLESMQRDIRDMAALQTDMLRHIRDGGLQLGASPEPAGVGGGYGAGAKPPGAKPAEANRGAATARARSGLTARLRPKARDTKTSVKKSTAK